MFGQSRGRSLRAVVLAAGRWRSSRVTSLSWCSATVVLCQSLTPASNLRGRPIWSQGWPWSTVRMEQRAFGGIPCLLRSDWSLRWLDVCIGTDALEKGCRELASEVGRVSERTRFTRSSRSVRAWSRALRSIAPDVGLECSSSDENEGSLAGRECRADFPEVSLQLLNPSDGHWRLVVASSVRKSS